MLAWSLLAAWVGASGVASSWWWADAAGALWLVSTLAWSWADDHTPRAVAIVVTRGVIFSTPSSSNTTMSTAPNGSSNA